MKKFTISFLGIDGSGKSTQAKLLEEWLRKNGYEVKLVEFHKWVFAHKLRKKLWRVVDKGRKSIDTYYIARKGSLSSFLKPIVALVDNLLLYLTSLLFSKEKIIIFDRFICSTQIKMKALNYHVEWLRVLWENFHTDIGFLLYVSPQTSVRRQLKRGDEYVYREEELQIELEEYLRYARKWRVKIIDTERKSEREVFEEIVSHVSRSLEGIR